MLRIRRFEEKCAELYGETQDPRLPAPLHRRGGRAPSARCTHLTPRGQRRRHLPRAWPCAAARRVDERHHGRDVRQAGRLLARARRLDAPVRRARRASTAATPSSAAACRWPSGWRWPTSCRARRDRVTACFFGEGAVAEGAFHESMNLAALWQLPVLFVCENNLYAMGTALLAQRVADRSDASRPPATTCRRRRSTAWTWWPCTTPHGRRWTQVRDAAGAVLPRAADLPLPRALDVRRRAVPRQGRGRGMEAARADPHLHRRAQGRRA